jgi:Holliday junction resolvase-like predicted endonuclease
MSEKIIVKKYSGEEQFFSREKLEQSLERSGADNELIERVYKELKGQMYDGITTNQIYRRAFGILRKLKRSTAARYSLRKAIMEMGPSGFPFEQLVGAAISRLGYETLIGKTVQGHCVSHELDVVARNKNELFMVECKFFNSQGKHCNVQVPLYINSRFHDVRKTWEKDPANQGLKMSGWVVTNTRFTSDAIDYGKCAGLNMVSWDYPKGKSLREMVEHSGLYPITVLTTLTRKQKDILLENNVVLCRQLLQKPEAFGKLGLDKSKQEKILKEAQDLVSKPD